MKTVLFLCCLSLQIFANSANKSPDIQVQYKIWTPSKISYVNYYREASTVAYEYLAQGITEVWKKMPHDTALLTRGFDHNKRSIEYDTIDLKMEHENSSWNQHANLLLASDFDFDNVQEKEIDNMTVLHYQKSTETTKTELYWDKTRDILLSFSIKKNDSYTLIYRLISVKAKKDSHIDDVLAYEATDFADIGDNESDPFFRKMIHLGFLTHKEANIIDEHGNSLELAHNRD